MVTIYKDILTKIKCIRSAPVAVVVVTCIALMIDNITYSISFACLPHLFEDMKIASESKIGLVTTMFGLGSFVTSIVSGIVSDRTGSRKLFLIVGSIGYSLCGIILYFSHKLWHILLYRFLNGLASGCVYPIAISTVGDVYPHNLLGLQMALLNAFNSIGYMIGPALGGAVYDSSGVHGVSKIIISIGCALSLIVTFTIKEPLAIHAMLLEKRSLRDLEKEMTITSSTGNESRHSSNAQDFDSPDKKPNMPLWKLAFQWQVLSASIVTLSTGMLIGSLEGVLPLYFKDRFNASASKIGLLFVLNGSTAIVLSPPAGWAIDKLINKYKEPMRMYIEITGLALAGCSVLVLGFSSSFGMTLALEAWLSFAILLVNIPVMSSFGDFVNGLGLNSMAQCYGIYNVFWALSSSVAPPIATFLYTRIGYKATVSGVLTSLCVVCIIVILGDSIAKLFRCAKRTDNAVQEARVGSVQVIS